MTQLQPDIQLKDIAQLGTIAGFIDPFRRNHCRSFKIPYRLILSLIS